MKLVGSSLAVVFIGAVFFGGIIKAQNAPVLDPAKGIPTPATTVSPKADSPSTPVSDGPMLAVLKAQHALDDINVKLMDLSSRWSDLQQQFMKSPQVDSLQTEGKALSATQKKAQSELEKAKTDAIKSAGLDPAKFDVEVSKGIYIPKAEPVPATPAAKK